MIEGVFGGEWLSRCLEAGGETIGAGEGSVAGGWS